MAIETSPYYDVPSSAFPEIPGEYSEGDVWRRPADGRQFRLTDVTNDLTYPYPPDFDPEGDNEPVLKWMPVLHITEQTQGDTGYDGIRGLDGPTGKVGVKGGQGATGATGAPGGPGPRGQDGDRGKDGHPGRIGPALAEQIDKEPDEYFTLDRGYILISKSNKVYVSTGL